MITLRYVEACMHGKAGLVEGLLSKRPLPQGLLNGLLEGFLEGVLEGLLESLLEGI
jgi:hypothetical protein